MSTIASAPRASGVVRARGVTVSYGTEPVLSGLDLDLPVGVSGIVGVNGVGKSTLIRVCLGLLRPRSGTVQVLGEDLAGDTHSMRSRVGYVPEKECLPRASSAVSFVERMARLSGVPRRRARDRAVDALRLVGVGEEGLRPMGGYSTGQRQRVRLAQALVHGPELIFLDEPTNGLDPHGREAILSLLETLGRDAGVSMVMTSHLLGDLRRVCDVVLELNPQSADVLSTGPAAQSVRWMLLSLYGPVDPTHRELDRAGLHAESVRTGHGESLRVAVTADHELDLVRDAVVSGGGTLLSLVPEGEVRSHVDRR